MDACGSGVKDSEGDSSAYLAHLPPLHWVSKSRAAIDLSAVRRIGVDETSSRNGHKYITQHEIHGHLYFLQGNTFSQCLDTSR